uniref:uncharacterized protein LOC108950584 n=1 Tax=Ciona intestinalis TaxID=7719 RepID=UPI00089DB1A4|nr:uncharacterized protein LOC108950584 [Ciona intestinalis]|eukprot:XP_018672111.1 uncharacterized protein LOC108950584 [Ciona intestinalis]
MGEILNTECECAAGKGPHCTCKHVASVCYLLMHTKTSGTVLLQKSCTSQLQMFHHPTKFHRGPPVTVEEMAKETGVNETIFDDPRREEHRNMEGYQDHVRRCVVQYCASTSKSITLRYLYNTACLITAQMDHDYLSLPFVEYWADRQTITNEQALAIEQATKAQHNCKQWHNERRFRITSSRIGEILAATCRRDMDKLCESMCIQHCTNYCTIFITWSKV